MNFNMIPLEIKNVDTKAGDIETKNQTIIIIAKRRPGKAFLARELLFMRKQ
jgi:hypothetical protein